MDAKNYYGESSETLLVSNIQKYSSQKKAQNLDPTKNVQETM
jgi:hypothetical protein